MAQKFKEFSREDHVFQKDDEIDELLKDILRFFNGTPVQPLPPTSSFVGAGVYALYYIGASELYTEVSTANRISYEVPIYMWVKRFLLDGDKLVRLRLPKERNSILA